MPFPEEGQRLAIVQHLLASHNRSLVQTELPLILPFGSGAAYALDREGRVAGFKFAFPPEPQRLIELILGFPYLQRLIFQAGLSEGEVPIEIPTAIGTLQYLKF